LAKVKCRFVGCKEDASLTGVCERHTEMIVAIERARMALNKSEEEEE
jgi:hypothetical protein